MEIESMYFYVFRISMNMVKNLARLTLLMWTLLDHPHNHMSGWFPKIFPNVSLSYVETSVCNHAGMMGARES